MAGDRIALAVLAFAVAAASAGAAAGDRAAAGFEFLPLVAPRGPVAPPASAPAPTQRPFCVRLCDGYFFPLPAASGPFADADEEAACRALCPAASVALYVLPKGADRIDEARAASGEPYAALPAAFRYRAAAAPACACRRAGESGLDYWRDPTLRSGDAVMTTEGVVVFRGAGGGAPYSRADFTPLDGAPLSPPQRSALGALAPASLAGPVAEEGRANGRAIGQTIGEARRAAGATAGGEIRFLAAPAAGGG